MAEDEQRASDDVPSKISFKAIGRDGKRVEDSPTPPAGEAKPAVSFKPLDKEAKAMDGRVMPRGEDSPTIVGVEEVPKKGTCIVCHLPVFNYDKDLFTCPNCGREAHFLCATIFVTEHGICPVCSTKLGKSKEGDGYIVLRK